MKMYEAVKNIKRLAPMEKLIIKTKVGLTQKEKKAVRNHSKIFRKHFFMKTEFPMQNVLPTSMLTPFTSSQVRKAVWTLKNCKSP